MTTQTSLTTKSNSDIESFDIKQQLLESVEGMDTLLNSKDSNAELRIKSLQSLLDFVCSMLLQSNVTQVMFLLFYGLRELRIRSTVDEWKPLEKLCLEHPLSELIFQDPLTNRSFYKPRGYAGDAVLLDYIYFLPPPPSESKELSSLGKDIYAFWKKESGACAVSVRREILAKSIDEIANRKDKPRILAVASGHLREAELSYAIQNNLVGEFIALDQDRESLAEIERCYKQYGITTMNSNLRPILTGKHSLGKFDLIYAAGLYDYLDRPLACRLTARLFSMLNPGGELLFTNFLPQVPAIGYMQSYMGWHLIVRSPEELRAVVEEIEPSLIKENKVYVEENQNIVFMHLTRKV